MVTARSRTRPTSAPHTTTKPTLTRTLTHRPVKQDKEALTSSSAPDVAGQVVLGQYALRERRLKCGPRLV